MARKRRKRRAPRYAGALAQPIYVDVDQNDRPEEVLAARVPEKMPLLFKHYRIDPSDEQSWITLALQLALDHVPGLQLALRPKAGRKPTWKRGLDDELVRAVEDVKSRTGKRTGDAIAKLTKEPGGCGDVIPSKTSAHATGKQSIARKSFVSLLKRHESFEHEGMCWTGCWVCC